MPASRVMTALFSGAALMNAAMAVASAVSTIVAGDRLGARWGAVPNTAGIVGTGVGALAVTALISRHGRRFGLTCGYVASACGAAVAAAGVAAGDVVALSAGMLLLGLGNAGAQLSRYAAADLYPPERRGFAIGTVVWAGAVGAVGGPLLLDPSNKAATALGQPPLTGPYAVAALATLGAAAAVALGLSTRDAGPPAAGSTGDGPGGLFGSGGEENEAEATARPGDVTEVSAGVVESAGTTSAGDARGADAGAAGSAGRAPAGDAVGVVGEVVPGTGETSVGGALWAAEGAEVMRNAGGTAAGGATGIREDAGIAGSAGGASAGDAVGVGAEVVGSAGETSAGGALGSVEGATVTGSAGRMPVGGATGIGEGAGAGVAESARRAHAGGGMAGAGVVDRAGETAVGMAPVKGTEVMGSTGGTAAGGAMGIGEGRGAVPSVGRAAAGGVAGAGAGVLGSAGESRGGGSMGAGEGAKVVGSAGEAIGAGAAVASVGGIAAGGGVGSGGVRAGAGRDGGGAGAPGRVRLRSAVRTPGARTALGVMATAQVVMVAVMTAAPLDMHMHGEGLGAVGMMLSAHTFGMFAFSPVTGWLLDRAGARAVMFGGLCTLVVATVLAATTPEGDALLRTAALFLLGYGWNLCFVGGSGRLARDLPAAARPGVEGAVDAAVWSIAAAASLASTLILAAGGYATLAWTACALIVVPAALILKTG